MNFSPEFKKYFANTSWLMGERILRMVVALATLGLDGIVVRELVKTPERKKELLGTAFGLKIVGAVLMWLLMLRTGFPKALKILY